MLLTSTVPNSCEEFADFLGVPALSMDELQAELEEIHWTSPDLLLPCPAVPHTINVSVNMYIEEISPDDEPIRTASVPVDPLTGVGVHPVVSAISPINQDMNENQNLINLKML